MKCQSVGKAVKIRRWGWGLLHGPVPRLTEWNGLGSGADLLHCRAPDLHFLQLRVQTAPQNMCPCPAAPKTQVWFGKPWAYAKGDVGCNPGKWLETNKEAGGESRLGWIRVEDMGNPSRTRSGRRWESMAQSVFSSWGQGGSNRKFEVAFQATGRTEMVSN